RPANQLEVLDLYRISMARFEVQLFCLVCCWPMPCPVLDDKVSVQPYAIAVFSGKSDQVVSCLWRHDDTRPAHREVAYQLQCDTRICPVEIDVRIRPRHRWRTLELWVRVIFRLQPVLLAIDARDADVR